MFKIGRTFINKSSVATVTEHDDGMVSVGLINGQSHTTRNREEAAETRKTLGIDAEEQSAGARAGAGPDDTSPPETRRV